MLLSSDLIVQVIDPGTSGVFCLRNERHSLSPVLTFVLKHRNHWLFCDVSWNKTNEFIYRTHSTGY